MPEDHHFTLAGLRWLLRFTRLRGGADGWAYLPDYKDTKKSVRKILIDSRLKHRRRLEVVIHECLHVLSAGPTVSEEVVTESARDLTRVLWALGYRKVD